MQPKHILLLLLLSSFSFCCNEIGNKTLIASDQKEETTPKNPEFETVLGIEIGKPLTQISKLRDSGIIKRDKTIRGVSVSDYIDYVDFKGELNAKSFDNNGVECIKSLTLIFCNRSVMDPNTLWLAEVTINDFNRIIDMYQQKYGEGLRIYDESMPELYYKSQWQKGNIIIEMLATNVLPLGTSQNLQVYVEYRMNDNASRKLLSDSFKEKI